MEREEGAPTEGGGVLTADEDPWDAASTREVVQIVLNGGAVGPVLQLNHLVLASPQLSI